MQAREAFDADERCFMVRSSCRGECVCGLSSRNYADMDILPLAVELHCTERSAPYAYGVPKLFCLVLDMTLHVCGMARPQSGSATSGVINAYTCSLGPRVTFARTA